MRWDRKDAISDKPFDKYYPIFYNFNSAVVQTAAIHSYIKIKDKDKVNKMSLMEDWEVLAGQYDKNQQMAQKFWTDYYMQEKAVYEKILTEPVEVHKGTVAELAEKFGMDVVRFGGFLDGINESLKAPNPVDTIVAESEVVIDIDLEKLYYNMVAAKADWLYNLPQWDALLPEERRKELYKAQKKSMTIVKGKKIGRNDPCPCGSGKKYKQCCGR